MNDIINIRLFMLKCVFQWSLAYKKSKSSEMVQGVSFSSSFFWGGREKGGLNNTSSVTTIMFQKRRALGSYLNNSKKLSFSKRLSSWYRRWNNSTHKK